MEFGKLSHRLKAAYRGSNVAHRVKRLTRGSTEQPLRISTLTGTTIRKPLKNTTTFAVSS